MHTTHAHLDIGDVRMQRQPRHGMHEHALAQRGAAASPSLEVYGRLHVHKRQRHKLGDAAAGLLLLSQQHLLWGTHADNSKSATHTHSHQEDVDTHTLNSRPSQ